MGQGAVKWALGAVLCWSPGARSFGSPTAAFDAELDESIFRFVVTLLSITAGVSIRHVKACLALSEKNGRQGTSTEPPLMPTKPPHGPWNSTGG